MRTVLPSNLDELKMDIDEREVIEFNDQMDCAALFACNAWRSSVTGSYPKWF
jgi:hypothetical protein